MTSSDEARRRYERFRQELSDYRSWDSEFSPNPYSPGAKLDRLLELGDDAVAPLCELLANGDADARWWAATGLRKCAGNRPEVLRALLAVPPGDSAEPQAVAAIALVDPDAYWSLPLDRRQRTLRHVCEAITAQSMVSKWLALFSERNDEAGLLTLLEGLRNGAPDEEVLRELTRVMQGSSPAVRAKASQVLSRTPNLGPDERLEAMLFAGEATALESVAWHPRSDVLIPVLIANGNVAWLGDLLERRRVAGLSSAPTPDLLAFIEGKLRRPNRSDFRFREHDVHDAARVALELADARLVPALVDCVNEDNAGYAWASLMTALRFFREVAEPLLVARLETKVKQVAWALEELKKTPPTPRVEWGDEAFVRGDIDHTSPCAFGAYSDALRVAVSPVAAFQLAWIDRAFGAPVTDDRIAWIKGLGFREGPLLEELRRPVVSLGDQRFRWRRCESDEQVAQAIAAGLPGLAWTRTKSVEHHQRATEHVAAVHASCG